MNSKKILYPSTTDTSSLSFAVGSFSLLCAFSFLSQLSQGAGTPLPSTTTLSFMTALLHEHAPKSTDEEEAGAIATLVCPHRWTASFRVCNMLDASPSLIGCYWALIDYVTIDLVVTKLSTTGQLWAQATINGEWKCLRGARSPTHGYVQLRNGNGTLSGVLSGILPAGTMFYHQPQSTYDMQCRIEQTLWPADAQPPAYGIVDVLSRYFSSGFYPHSMQLVYFEKCLQSHQKPLQQPLPQPLYVRTLGSVGGDVLLV